MYCCPHVQNFVTRNLGFYFFSTCELFFNEVGRKQKLWHPHWRVPTSPCWMPGCANHPLVDTWCGFSILMSNHPECVLQHVHPLWTHALWWQYQHSIIHTKCLKTPCAFTAPHSCIQFTLSKKNHKSGLPTHTRTQTAKSLSITRHFPNQYALCKNRVALQVASCPTYCHCATKL